MLRICDVTTAPTHVVQEYATTYSFPLDPFQQHAIAAIDQGHNVLVCAKTGSGKTLVGEYQIAHSLKQGKRVFYTTPIKSLSNQKFHDLKTMWPEPGAVGIMTGDIKFCPTAQIIVMTTEILRNLLYKKGTQTEHLGLTASLSLDDLGAVIFDECHYINDKDRGKVWEETMILLPRDVQLVLLSATLDKPEFFAEWLGELKQTPCHLIQTAYRIVPLTHSIVRGSNLYTIMDPKEIFHEDVYADWVRNRVQTELDHEAYQRKVANARRQGHEGPVDGKVKPVSFIHQLNSCVSMLHEKNLLPALCFVLSRKGCEKHAVRIEDQLLDSSDSSKAHTIFDFHLRTHKAELETIAQYHTLRKLIAKGIAFHHSGVLPVLKEVVEILFSKGLIKLLFCTETFAVGINMPTKTVIFTGLHKYDDSVGGMRMLRTDEYIQMAGRAGRRGKDTMGQVIYLPEYEVPSTAQMRGMMKGGKPQISSRMDFHYDFILKTFHAQTLSWMKIQETSYWWRQQQSQIAAEERECERLESKLGANPLASDVREALEEGERLANAVATLTNAKRRDAQRKYDAWKADHDTPQWTMYINQLKAIRTVESDLAQSRKTLADLRTNRGSVEEWIQVLKRLEYVTDSNTLTALGTIATEFNEGHPLLCSQFFTRGHTKHLTGPELLAAMACLIEEKETEATPSLDELAVPDAIKTALFDLDDCTRTITRLEHEVGVHSPETYWSLSTTWIEPIWRWLNGANAAELCNDYGIFEGNFVRTVLRVANMADEWTAVATLAGDVDLVEKLAGVRQTLVRGFIQPDSLYLHL